MTWACSECGYKYSACMGDDEVPEICQCGGKVMAIDFNLVLSDYERGYLTAYYDTVVFDAMAGCCDEDWFGVQIGDRMFDLNAWVDEDTGSFVCAVYECDWINDNWQTNCRHSWVLTEEK